MSDNMWNVCSPLQLFSVRSSELQLASTSHSRLILAWRPENTMLRMRIAFISRLRLQINFWGRPITRGLARLWWRGEHTCGLTSKALDQASASDITTMFPPTLYYSTRSTENLKPHTERIRITFWGCDFQTFTNRINQIYWRLNSRDVS